MQAIATEFNYSETTFVLPPADAHTARVRISADRVESVRVSGRCVAMMQGTLNC